MYHSIDILGENVSNKFRGESDDDFHVHFSSWRSII